MLFQSSYISMMLVINVIATTCLIQGYVMKRFSCYLISACDEKKLSFLKDDVIYLYFVRDKSSFVWTRWMSYGLYFLVGWMVNHEEWWNLKVTWGVQEVMNSWIC